MQGRKGPIKKKKSKLCTKGALSPLVAPRVAGGETSCEGVGEPRHCGVERPETQKKKESKGRKGVERERKGGDEGFLGPALLFPSSPLFDNVPCGGSSSLIDGNLFQRSVGGGGAAGVSEHGVADSSSSQCSGTGSYQNDLLSSSLSTMKNAC